MMGTRVGVYTADIHPNGQTRICRRCGIEWLDTSWNYAKGAPCLDCREWYRDEEGLPFYHWKRPAKQPRPRSQQQVAA